MSTILSRPPRCPTPGRDHREQHRRLSALIHNKPLKVMMGKALYDIEGLTAGPLNQFWQADFAPDAKLFQRFRTHLLYQNADQRRLFTASPTG